MPAYGIVGADAGEGLLPWSWAEERIAASRNYWVATLGTGGAPHAMPVWGVWVAGRLYFSTSPLSRKARNLASDPRCVVHTESGDEAVIIEGSAATVDLTEGIALVGAPYREKYDFELTGAEGPIYAVTPRVAFGFIEAASRFAQTATRWRW
jgi:hypothetical protein